MSCSGGSEQDAAMRAEPGRRRPAWLRALLTGALPAILAAALVSPRAGFCQAAAQQAQEPSAPAAAPESQPQTSNESTEASSTPPLAPTGWVGFEQFQFSLREFGGPPGSSGDGVVWMEDTDLGYAFTEHFTAELGVPIILTRSPYSPAKNSYYYWEGLLGEPYVDVRYSRSYESLNFTSVLTGTIPVNSLDKVYTTGRFGVDLYNHVDEHLGNLTPFLNFGVSHGAVNRFVMPRPYTEARPFQSLGVLTDAEAGGEYKFTKWHANGVALGLSAYLVAPAGPQKVYSRFVFPYSSVGGDGYHNRNYDATFETTGGSQIARDNGFSAWVDVTRWSPVELQFGYTRSVHYAQDIYTFVLTFDARSFLREHMPHRR
jgi:hypothetical protein